MCVTAPRGRFCYHSIVKKRLVIVLVILAAATLLVAGGATLYQNQSNTTQSTNVTTSPSTDPAKKNKQSVPQPPKVTPKTTPQKIAAYPVKVYFSRHPASDDDPSRTFPVDRVSPDLGVGKFTITELLKGPTQDEATQGYFSYAKLRSEQSNCQGADFTLNIGDKIATLRFCKTFDHIGSVSDGQAESEIKATLTQFDAIEKVVILNKNGDCEFNLSGLNLCKQ